MSSIPSEHRKQLEDLTLEICERSEGVPGAINVMCAGVLGFGKDFYDLLVTNELKGSKIWEFYKDECGEDLFIMWLNLGWVSPQTQKTNHEQ